MYPASASERAGLEARWESGTGTCPRAMRLAVLSGFEYAGGGNIAATRLSWALCQLGVHVTRIFPGGAQSGREPYGACFITPLSGLPLPIRAAFRCARFLPVEPSEARDGVFHWFVERELANHLKRLRPDVINVQSLVGAGWPVRLVSVCQTFAPTVWTLHDMWSFTGGCIQSMGCRRFEQGCSDECPEAESQRLIRHRIRAAWDERRRLMDNPRRLVAVSPSRWLQGLAQQGLWKGKRVAVIRNGLDLDVFAPMDRAAARSELGLPRSGTVIAAAAGDLDLPMKGAALLAGTLREAGPDLGDYALLMAGATNRRSDWDGVPVRWLDTIPTEEQMARVLNAADLFVHPSLAENYPNVIAESLACGTPVLAFGVGGVPELVVPGVTGWLAGEPSTDSLGITLRQALTALSSGLNLRESCRRFAQREFEAKARAREYLSLFEELTAQ